MAAFTLRTSCAEISSLIHTPFLCMSSEASETSPSLSFVLPVHNESACLRELHHSITDVCRSHAYIHEIIFVDDGSSDDSFAILQDIARQDSSVRLIRFTRNYGQTAALNAGIHASRAPSIVTLDADLQNDPRDVPRLMKKIDEGYDVVSGWRKHRRDSWIRTLPSKAANILISWITGVRLSDYGCTLKVYRREFIHDVPLYGDMHRFMPVLAAWHGARVTELAVEHRPRRTGRSHYGLGRTGRVILDLLTVKFLHTYISRPMHFFGGVGIWFILFGMLSGSLAVLLKVLAVRTLVDTPLPLLSVFLGILGTQCVLLGLLGELLIRIYFDRINRTAYHVHPSTTSA